MNVFPPAVFREEGFTLIEAVIAMAVLLIGIIGLYTMQISSVKTNARASSIVTASNWATDRVEKLLHTAYDDLTDPDSDGTNQDADNDSIDDDGGNFGLDDRDAAADGQLLSPDGNYGIFWNVADNFPIAGSKSIRIYVVDNNRVSMAPIIIDYIKQGPI